nr:MAG TPA: hypothetical protein [Caudoviricetes sp.]
MYRFRHEMTRFDTIKHTYLKKLPYFFNKHLRK